uniref:ATP synthase peripheral stalk subunit F6, mitochondrial n=1 Tax=Eptatretus burgeri TaxID=7764 RepID=A0A8C4WV49_EPTBU
MALNAAWKGFSPLRTTLAVMLQRNFGLTAVALNKIKELDPIQKLFVDKIQEYSRKSKKVPLLIGNWDCQNGGLGKFLQKSSPDPPIRKLPNLG